MKSTGRGDRGYKLTYKKKTASTDSYLPRGAAQSISVCEKCHSVYKNKRWYADRNLYHIAKQKPESRETVCPACMKIRDNFPGGILTLKGGYVVGHKQELMKLIKNEEERARAFNPLERIMSVQENGSGKLVVSTTNEKLAQRLGRSIKKAFHGAVSYNWSHDNKLVRVEWERAA